MNVKKYYIIIALDQKNEDYETKITFQLVNNKNNMKKFIFYSHLSSFWFFLNFFYSQIFDIFHPF